MKRLILLLFLLCIGFAFAEDYDDAIPPEGLEVHFIAVGRNDAMLIVCDGEAAFVDSGTYSCAAKCISYLNNIGVKNLKYYIGTHAHTDHVGGAPAILAAFPTQEILTDTDLTLEAMLSCTHSSAETEAVKAVPMTFVRKGDAFNIGSAVLECIGPDKIVRFAKYTEPTENNNSLIFRLTYGDVSFMLLADTTSTIMNEMLANDSSVFDCTVFKSPHHNAGFSDEVAKQIECEYYVFSTDTKNPPSTHMLNNAKRMGARVFITNDNNSGSVVFFTDGESVYHLTEKTLDERWKLDISNVTLKVGNHKSVKLTLKPSKEIDTIFWESSDPSVATADLVSGKITAVGAGSCVIRAIGYDDSVREINVTVKAN